MRILFNGAGPRGLELGRIMPCGVVWCGAVRCGAVRCGAVRYGSVWFEVIYSLTDPHRTVRK